MRALWKELDADKEGFVTMREFCPEIGALYYSFLDCLRSPRAELCFRCSGPLDCSVGRFVPA